MNFTCILKFNLKNGDFIMIWGSFAGSLDNFLGGFASSYKRRITTKAKEAVEMRFSGE